MIEKPPLSAVPPRHDHVGAWRSRRPPPRRTPVQKRRLPLGDAVLARAPAGSARPPPRPGPAAGTGASGNSACLPSRVRSGRSAATHRPCSGWATRCRRRTARQRPGHRQEYRHAGGKLHRLPRASPMVSRDPLHSLAPAEAACHQLVGGESVEVVAQRRHEVPAGHDRSPIIHPGPGQEPGAPPRRKIPVRSAGQYRDARPLRPATGACARSGPSRPRVTDPVRRFPGRPFGSRLRAMVTRTWSG